MKTTFEKTKCQLLCVNSLKEPNPQGIFMDNHDWESVDNLVKEFISKGLIPYMQSKISILNEFVSIFFFFFIKLNFHLIYKRLNLPKKE